MSWSLLHDRDNLLRDGRATISSTPTRLPGSSLGSLRDGVQAIPCRFVGLQSRELVVTLPQTMSGIHFSFHDLWVEGNDFTSVSILWAGGELLVYREELERWGWSAGVTPAGSGSTIGLRVNPIGGNADWGLSELCVGVAMSPEGNVSPPRSTEYGRAWNTVENGPWRTKIAEPLRSYTAFLPAGRGRDDLEELMLASEGGLRPVSFLPRGNGPAILGHLGDEFMATEGLGGIWEEGVSFSVRESMRPIR